VDNDQPSVEEIRNVFCLVNACCECWDHPNEWQAVLLEGISEIFSFKVAILQTIEPGDEVLKPKIHPIASTGWGTPKAEQLYLDSLFGEGRPQLPNVDKALEPAMLVEGTMAFSRPMIVPDDMWYESAFYQCFVEPTGLDEWGSSFRVAPKLGSVVMVGGNRAYGDEPITPRQITLLGILAEEITPMLGTRLSMQGQLTKAGLTPRQRQTLEFLLDGLSEKQIANRLNLSKATIHDYIVQLHRHFDVSSRGELLSYFVKRRPKDSSKG